ncbi:MAG: DUF481 domain-containing protein [Paludibacter sp.]|nr:DUF481 domain-containing protein [Paludibacter sp.]
MKYLFFFVFLIVSYKGVSQKKISTYNKSFQFDIGTSFNGSGDLGGFVVYSEYNKYFKKHFSYSVGLGATFHDNSSISNNSIDERSLYITIAGLEVLGKIGYSFVKTNKHDLGVKLGVLIRYQSNSTDSYETDYPPYNGYNVPIVIIVNNEPQRSLSLGGIAQLYYNYSINEKIFVGTSGSFQSDTNEDAISKLSLTFGMRFN